MADIVANCKLAVRTKSKILSLGYRTVGLSKKGIRANVECARTFLFLRSFCRLDEPPRSLVSSFSLVGLSVEGGRRRKGDAGQRELHGSSVQIAESTAAAETAQSGRRRVQRRRLGLGQKRLFLSRHVLSECSLRRRRQNLISGGQKLPCNTVKIWNYGKRETESDLRVGARRRRYDLSLTM